MFIEPSFSSNLQASGHIKNANNRYAQNGCYSMGMSACASSAHAGKCSSTAIATSFAAGDVLGQINQLDQTYAVEQEQLGIDHRHSRFQA